MAGPRERTLPPKPAESEKAWLRTFMHLVRVSPKLVREPDAIDRQVNEKYNLGLDLDSPRDPMGTPRAATTMFCEEVTPQQLTKLMRDDELRLEMRTLLEEVPVVREIFAAKQPAFLGLIDTDPPPLQLIASDVHGLHLG